MRVPAGVDLVVDEDRPPAPDVADDVHELGLVEVALAPLLDDRQRRAEQLRERPCPLGEAEVGHDHRLLDVLVDEVVREEMDRRQLVDRDVEEALDLALVEVHRQDPVGAGHRDHVGDEAGRDGDPGLVLLVGAAVRVERQDRRDPPGARPLEGVDHDQQFHDRLVDRVAGRLDEEDVLLADVVEDLDEDVLVGELEHLGPTGLRAEIAADLRGEIGVRVAVVDLELICVHGRLLLAGRDPQRHDAGVAPLPTGSGPSGPSLSSMVPWSASPARKAAMPTTRSPSSSRMTMTPRAPDE